MTGYRVAAGVPLVLLERAEISLSTAARFMGAPRFLADAYG